MQERCGDGPCRAQVHMPPEPPRPLDHRPDRGQIAHHHIKIQIERLFGHLRGHQHTARAINTRAAKAGLQGSLVIEPVAKCETRVQQVRLDAQIMQRLNCFNRIVNRVAHPDTSRALGRGLRNGLCSGIRRRQPPDPDNT